MRAIALLLLTLSARAAALPTARPLSAAHATDESADDRWALIGVEAFDVSGEYDWFGNRNDVYATMRVQPAGWTYTSQVMYDTNHGILDYFAHVPTSSEVLVEIWDSDTLNADDRIGSATVSADELAAASGASRTTAVSLDDGSTITLTYASGRAAIDLKASLNFRGVTSHVDPSPQVRQELYRIPVDGVENHISFARAGSVFPESLQGVWWMDQRGVHLRDYPDGPPSDPTYEQQCEVAADEFVVTWGEAGWDPSGAPGGCATNVNIHGGSPTRGHWTWMDVTGDGRSTDWEASWINVPIMKFCFEDVERSQLALTVSWNNIGDIRSLEHLVYDLKMVKKPWGWDRVTIVGGGLLECHYPVWQIVDGAGNRTEHYEAYRKFATTPGAPGQQSSTFAQPNNRGDGTQLVPRLVAPA